jgi:hypothetical protein
MKKTLLTLAMIIAVPTSVMAHETLVQPKETNPICSVNIKFNETTMNLSGDERGLGKTGVYDKISYISNISTTNNFTLGQINNVVKTDNIYPGIQAYLKCVNNGDKTNYYITLERTRIIDSKEVDAQNSHFTLYNTHTNQESYAFEFANDSKSSVYTGLFEGNPITFTKN